MKITQTEKDASKTAAEIINKIINDLPSLRSLFPSSAGYTYFTREGSKDRYFYTTERVMHNGKEKFVAGIYRYHKTYKRLKLVKKAGFGKRKTACARAEKWRDEVK